MVVLVVVVPHAHIASASVTHVESHWLLQQNRSLAQIAVTHGSHPDTRPAPATQGEWAHVPPLDVLVLPVVMVDVDRVPVVVVLVGAPPVPLVELRLDAPPACPTTRSAETQASARPTARTATAPITPALRFMLDHPCFAGSSMPATVPSAPP